MPLSPVRPRNAGWFAPSFAIAFSVTALRLALLPLNQTDLFVDESQYWLWGQNLAFGYFSKPPMIGWVIGFVTRLAQSDAPFWVRMPGAVLHGTTALILAALAFRLSGRAAAIWTAAVYVTLPLAAVGSLLMSTDTVMAPFFAGALLAYHRLLTDHRRTDAVWTGCLIGCACLAKYAGLYLPCGMLLVALMRADLRPSRTEVVLITLPAVAIFAPNVIWNVAHGWSTFGHTAHNMGWGIPRHGALAALASLADFLLVQLAVAGPLVFGAIVVGLWHWRKTPFLTGLTLPALLAVALNALEQNTNANWTVGSYFAGSVLAVWVLASHPVWRAVSLAINGCVGLALPLLTLDPTFGIGAEPLLRRYVGRAEVSRHLIDLAQRAGVDTIVTANRDVIADLFYTGRDAGLHYYAPRSKDAPAHHYAQTYPVPLTLTGQVLLISQTPPLCEARLVQPDLKAKAYCHRPLAAYEVTAACARDQPESSGCK